MKLSFCTDSLGHLPFEAMLDRLGELGVFGVEIDHRRLVFGTASGHRGAVAGRGQTAAADGGVGKPRHENCGAERFR